MWVVDGALPDSLLSSLQGAFSPDSSFWTDHDYWSGNTGYFSYADKIGRGQSAREGEKEEEEQEEQEAKSEKGGREIKRPSKWPAKLAGTTRALDMAQAPMF